MYFTFHNLLSSVFPLTISRIMKKSHFSVLKWNILSCFVLVGGGCNKLLNWIINCGEVLQSEILQRRMRKRLKKGNIAWCIKTVRLWQLCDFISRHWGLRTNWNKYFLSLPTTLLYFHPPLLGKRKHVFGLLSWLM